MVAASMFSPRTSSDFEAILACPNAAPCLVPPYTRRCTESTSMNTTVSAPGSIGVRAASSTSTRRCTAASWRTLPWSNGPQEAAQRRRGADPADRGRERAVAQQVHPVDGVGAGDHPGHQRTDLQPGVGADLGGHPHMLSGQVLQPDVLGQPHGRYQPGVRHQIRIIKPGVRRGRGMQQSHPRGALSILALRASATRILPGQRALLLLRHASGDNPGGGSRLMRWIRKKHERLRGKKKARTAWNRAVKERPRYFAHWAWTSYAPTVW